MNKADLLRWFWQHHEHVISHYISSVSNITRTQLTKDKKLDSRYQPSGTVQELISILGDNATRNDYIEELTGTGWYEEVKQQ